MTNRTYAVGPLASQATIQAQLDLGGLVQLAAGVTYTLTDELVLRSDTILDLNGATLRLGASAATRMVKNYNVTTAAKSVTGNITSAALAGSERFSLSTVACTAHGYAVGSYVLIKGDTTKTYNGIHKVYSVADANTFAFVLPDGNHAGIPGNSAGTITATQADAHITIRNGTLDFNEMNGNNVGGLDGFMCVWNKVLDLQMQNLKLLRVNKYAVFGANVWSPRFYDIYFDTGSDGFHFTGSCRDIVIDGVSGRTGDDVFAYTEAEAEYTLTDPSPNELLGLSISNMTMERSGSRGILLAPNSSTRVSGIRLKNIHVQRCTGPVLLLDSPSTTGVFEDVSVDGISGGYAADGGKLIGIGDNHATTIKSLFVKGVRNSPTDTRLSGDMIALNNASTVTRLTIDDADVVFSTNTGDARAMVYALGGSTVTDLVFTNCKTDGLGTNDNSYKWARLNGNTSSFSRVVANGGKLKGQGQIADHDSDISAHYIITGGLVMDSFSSLVGGGKGFTVTVNGLVAIAAGQIFNFWGTSKTYNVYIKGLINAGGVTVWGYGTTNTINLRAGDDTAAVDITKVARINGVMAMNTNAAAGTLAAAGMVVCQGTAANSWKLLSDTSKAY